MSSRLTFKFIQVNHWSTFILQQVTRPFCCCGHGVKRRPYSIQWYESLLTDLFLFIGEFLFNGDRRDTVFLTLIS